MTSSLHTLQRVLEIVPDMCFVVSNDLRIVDCNQRARRVTGLPTSLNGAIPFLSLLTADSARPHFDAISRNGTFDSQEVRFKTRDAAPVDALLHIKSITEQGKEYYFIIGRDISESKQKELDLLRFSNVVHYTVNPIQITDAQGRMIYVNPAFEKATGYTKDELIGRNPSIISSKKYAAEFWQRVWATIRTGRVWNGEVENRRKDGKPLYTQLLISPIIQPDGEVIGYLGSHRDITEQKALEQQLVHAQKMESIGTLAAGIAHEVGNPLASISSLVQVVQRTIIDEFAREKLGLVESQVHRITKIIRDLVDFSRPSKYQLQPSDLVKILTDAVEIVKMGKKAKQVTFYTHVRQQIPLLSLVPDQIAQVFINILLNAVDALHGKTGTITTDFERDDTRVRVTITDDGAGISPENLSKIFEPFFTTKRVGEGTGLGLWVSYGIIRSFRGDITVTSEPGRGTAFSITLPLNPQQYDHGRIDSDR
jgi:PAS domain S-box-containing protein